MKFGIIVNGRVTEPVTIPAQHEAAAAAWLAKQFPTLVGWFVVHDDAVPGTIDHGDGRFKNPEPPNTKAAVLLSATAFMDVAIAGLKAANNSTQAAAEARFSDIIDAAEMFLPGGVLTETAKRIRYVWSVTTRQPSTIRVSSRAY
jgi:hypothetical protein